MTTIEKPTSIKGRKLVGAIWYYHCHCGEPRGPLLLTGFENDADEYNSVLLTGDGALFLFREKYKVPSGILVTEIGRQRCTCPCDRCVRLQEESGDHVWYDWKFYPA